MTGDYSRWTAPNAKERGYAGLLMQQGRLYTDADWNEAVSIQTRRSETALTDIIGRTGTPKSDMGFEITTGSGGFGIGAGRYYVDGLMVENSSATSHDAQGGDIPVPPFTTDIADGNDVLVFLEVQKPTVTAMEDPRLADPALGGPDTGTRIKAQWRVGVREISLTDAQHQALIDRARCGMLPDIADWQPGTGEMRAGTAPAAALPDDTDCLIPPEAGYLSQENQLYRVQIIRGGSRSQARFVWSRENASVQAILDRNADGAFILRGAREDEALGFVNGGWVEVYDDRNSLAGTTGIMTRITLNDGVVTFSDSIGDFTAMVRPRVRRWDHGGTSANGLSLSTSATDLERGVQVSFSAGTYREGDFWVFEARAATGTVIWPPYPLDDPLDTIPPMGWGRRFAPLALARRSGSGLSDLVDLRADIPTLTCLEAEDIGFDDSACNLGADTVQDALEALCMRETGTGLCTIVVSNAFELVAAVQGLSRGQSVRICLRAGQFALQETLIFDNLAHVTVIGTGPQTVVSTTRGEPAFAFDDCATVRVTDMSVNGGPTGTESTRRDIRKGRLGAIMVSDSGDTQIERVRVRCRAGLDRQTACISYRNSRPRGQVLIRDCVMRVGQSQIGVNIIGSRRAIVQDNLILPVPSPKARDRITADPVLVSRIARGLLNFSNPTPGNGGDVRLIGSARGDTGGGIAIVPLAQIGRPGIPNRFSLENGGTVQAFVHPDILNGLLPALEQNRGQHIDRAFEMRQHLDNIVSEAVRNDGRAFTASVRRRIFSNANIAVANETYLAQGIVVAGDVVDEVRVTGNRIERAVDGIRIAASGTGDPVPPNWGQQRPPNSVLRAVVHNNTISVAPISNVTAAFGIYFGHVASAMASHNVIVGPGGRPGGNERPHFAMHQYGYRGSHLTWSENMVDGLYYGYAVLPNISDNLSGTWRLRDNSAENVTAPYAVVGGVDVF